MGDNTNVLAFGLQDGALFDVQFKEGMHLARADFLVPTPADPLELIAEFLALCINTVIGPILRMDPRKDTRRQHRRRVARALFIGEVRHHDGMFGLNAQIVQGADDLQAAQHAKHAVVFPARGLGIEVTADIDGQRIGVRAFAAGKHVAHLIQPHRAARILAPFLEQGAAFAVFIGERLAVVAACDTGADLGHFHQAVPQTVRVDLEVLTGCWHVLAPWG